MITLTFIRCSYLVKAFAQPAPQTIEAYCQNNSEYECCCLSCYSLTSKYLVDNSYYSSYYSGIGQEQH